MLSEAGSPGAGAGFFESQQFINVIHESVSEFFMKGDAFQLLNDQIKGPVGDGHAYLLEVCIKYYFLDEMMEAFGVQRPSRIELERIGSLELTRPIPWHTSSYSGRDDSDDATSLGGSAGGSIHSGHSHHSRRESRLRLGERFSNATKLPAALSRTPLKPGQAGNSVVSFILNLGSPNIDTQTPAELNTVIVKGSSSDLELVKTPPVLWQYCQDMSVFHAVAADQAGVFPEEAVEFPLRQDSKVWAKTLNDMQQKGTLLYFAAQRDLVPWMNYLYDKGYCQIQGGELQFPIIVAAKNDNLAAFNCIVNHKVISLQKVFWVLGEPFVDRQGRSALHHAAMVRNSSVLSHIRELVEFR